MTTRTKREIIPALVFLVLGLILLTGPNAHARSKPPAALLGKSVVVSWNETRVQRRVGEANFRNVQAHHVLSVYVSEKGRVFSRLTNTIKVGSGSTDQIAGSGGRSSVPARVPTFSGGMMTIFQPFQAGGMRHITVNFDGSFGSCSASVSHAKEVGKKANIAYSPITKVYVEFRSITPSGTSCSMRSGNVFTR
jgi:hypothetical protein